MRLVHCSQQINVGAGVMLYESVAPVASLLHVAIFLVPWNIERARELRAQNPPVGWRMIAKEVGVSYQTIRRELRGKQ